MSNQNGTCTHIKVTGLRCGSPALHGEQFCYFHQNAHRGVQRPKQSRLHPIALIEDEESIQYALMEVINALMRNTIDLKRATLILRALHIAVKNAGRVKYQLGAREMVKKIPDYADPTEEHEVLATASDLPAVAANPNLPVGPEGPHYWEQKAEAARRTARDEAQRFAAEANSREEARKRFAEERAAEAKAREKFTATQSDEHAETAAIGSPAKPQAKPNVGVDPLVLPASKARVSAVGATTPAKAPTTVPPHDFKPTKSAATVAPAINQRKPPAPAPQAPKERKNAAHAVRHG